jgi:hypothetical protein
MTEWGYQMTETEIMACEERAIEYLAGGENREETLRLRMAYGLGANDVLLLVAEVRRLQEALIDYGEHQCVLPRGCPRWAHPLDRDAICTCGLDDALMGGNAR